MDTVEDALAAVRKGSFAIVVDDFDRENEGDFIASSSHATKDSVALMLRHTTGIVCVAVTRERAAELALPLMVPDNRDPYRTAFTVTVDYRHGTTTGVGAADRAATIRAIADCASKPDDFTRPGHVFPLLAQPGGVLVRGGHTEASVDLARMAGCGSSGYLCEVYDQCSGDMARLPALSALSASLALPLISIADMQRWRYRREVLVREVGEGARRTPPSAASRALLACTAPPSVASFSFSSLYGGNEYEVHAVRGQGGEGGMPQTHMAVWFEAAEAVVGCAHWSESGVGGGDGGGRSGSAARGGGAAFGAAVASHARALPGDVTALFIAVLGQPWENVRGKEAAVVGTLSPGMGPGEGAGEGGDGAPASLLPVRPPGVGAHPSAYSDLYRVRDPAVLAALQGAQGEAGTPSSWVCDRVCAEVAQAAAAVHRRVAGLPASGREGGAPPSCAPRSMFPCGALEAGGGAWTHGDRAALEARAGPLSTASERQLRDATAQGWLPVTLLHLPGSLQPLPSVWEYGVELGGVRRIG